MNLPFAHVSRWTIWLSLALASLAIGSSALAQDVSATAAFSRAVTTVDEPVRFEVRITGSRRVESPPDVRVDGLDIRYVGPQTQVQMRNFDLTMSVTHLYQATPQRAGTFTVPALTVQAEGQTLRTEPVMLTVQATGGAGNAAGGSTAPGSAGTSRVAWAEIVLPKQTAYVGETLPVEVRLIVDSRVRWNLESMPTLEGEGFTKTKLTEPRQEKSRRDGREYDVLVFRTALTASKAGKIQVGPAEMNFAAQVPRARRNRSSSRSLFDMFDDDIFADPSGPFAAMEQRKARADVVELEVKPLPSQGRPGSFQGAVGQYKISAEGNPKRIKMGDPLTMSIKVSGRGSFDRVQAPGLANPDGWRTYPPSTTFQGEDDLNFRGTKTFEVAVIPETRKTQMPVFEFSYFDPTSEQYVALRTETAPLQVDGEAPKPSPAPAVAQPLGESSSFPPEQTAPPQPQPTDIAGIQYGPGTIGNFDVPHRSRDFWLWQLLPLGLLAAWVARAMWRIDARAAEIAGWKRERAALLSRLRTEEDRLRFYDLASRALQLETAISTGRPPGAIDGAAIRRFRAGAAGAEDEQIIEEIFDARAEVMYAGVATGPAGVATDERERVIAAVVRRR